MGRSLVSSGTPQVSAIERSPGRATKLVGSVGGSRLRIGGASAPPDDGTDVAVGAGGGMNGGGAGAEVGVGITDGLNCETESESNPLAATGDPDSYNWVLNAPEVLNTRVSVPNPVRLAVRLSTAPSDPDTPPGLLHMNAEA